MSVFIEFLWNVMIATGSLTFVAVDDYLDPIGIEIRITDEDDFLKLKPNTLYAVKDGDDSNNAEWRMDGLYQFSGQEITTMSLGQFNFHIDENIEAFHKY